MSKFVIESNIPMPTKKRKSRYDSIPFETMKVGQSVLIDQFPKRDVKRRFKAIYSGIYKLSVKKGLPMAKYKLAIRDVPRKKDKSEVRIWRIA